MCVFVSVAFSKKLLWLAQTNVTTLKTQTLKTCVATRHYEVIRKANLFLVLLLSVFLFQLLCPLSSRVQEVEIQSGRSTHGSAEAEA